MCLSLKGVPATSKLEVVKKYELDFDKPLYLGTDGHLTSEPSGMPPVKIHDGLLRPANLIIEIKADGSIDPEAAQKLIRDLITAGLVDAVKQDGAYEAKPEEAPTEVPAPVERPPDINDPLDGQLSYLKVVRDQYKYEKELGLRMTPERLGMTRETWAKFSG